MEEDDDIVTTADSAGQEVLSVGVRQFLAARVGEITSLTRQLAGTGGVQGRGKGFSFQHVNKHMRRRAVSHNAKRLPTRLRASHLAQVKKSSGGVRKKPKKPRRKWRKRSDKNVLEYNRRQLANPKWLESHIWHAKRFHMKALWNRKLAIAPTAKCFRALFRGIKLSAIMQDISYLTALEVIGPMSIVVEGISSLIKDPIASPSHRSQEILAHAYSVATGGYLGPIKYLRISGGSEECGRFLIWTHPLIKLHIVMELCTIFLLEQCQADQPFPEFPTIDEKKYLWRLVTNFRWHNHTSRVMVHEADGAFNRIRVVGQRTLTILKEILKIGNPSLSGVEPSSSLDEEISLWKSIKTIGSVPNGTVVQLNVVDPRGHLPIKRSSASKGKEEETGGPEITESCQKKLLKKKLDSPLWNEEGRRLILREKTSDHLLSQRRSKNLIPGTSLNDAKPLDVVPIALVFQSSGGSFSGVDLILPCGWLMPFWIALSYRCVRSFALEFNDYLTFEENPYLLDFTSSTRLSPDSVLYNEQTDKSAFEAKTKYFSYPPAKRHNLIKLACAFPFRTDWATFLRLSATDLDENMATSVTVLRSIQDLQPIFKSVLQMNPTSVAFSNSNALVPVRVILASGVAEKGCSFCIPNEEDLRLFKTRKHTQVHIVQKPAKDTNERQRTELNRLHQKDLARLRKKRKVARKASHKGLNKSFDLKARLNDLDSHACVTKYNQDMNQLWLPSSVDQVLRSQEREVIGFSEYAHFSFVRGKVAAVGYVTVAGLKKLLETHKRQGFKKGQPLRLLVRNWASSLTYHWAKMELPNQFNH